MAGFRTTVFPIAKAGHTFHANNITGKFHGTIAPTTPEERGRENNLSERNVGACTEKGVTIVLPNRGWKGTVVRFRMSKTFS